MSELSPWQVALLALLTMLGMGVVASVLPSSGWGQQAANVQNEMILRQPAWAVGALPVAAPTATPGTRAFRVAIQIGHYKNDELPPELSRLEGSTGTSGGGRTEVDLNYDVAQLVARLLRAKGVIVEVLPATVPTGDSADAFVAIHADGAAASGPRGFKISTRWSSEVAVQDGMLVDQMIDAYRRETGLPEDSNVTRNMRGYYAYSPRRPTWRVSNFTPSAIVEMGYMTNAADRAVLFNKTGLVATGIVNGIMDFLHAAYGSQPTGNAYGYGYGLVDNNIVPPGSATPTRVPGTGTGAGAGVAAGAPGGASRPQPGSWQVVFIDKAQTGVYTGQGSGDLVGKVNRGQVLTASIRQGDYYYVTLPNGKQGWVNRTWIVVQM